MHIHTNVHMYMYLQMCIYVYIYMYGYILMYVHICVYICVFTYISTQCVYVQVYYARNKALHPKITFPAASYYKVLEWTQRALLIRP